MTPVDKLNRFLEEIQEKDRNATNGPWRLGGPLYLEGFDDHRLFDNNVDMIIPASGVLHKTAHHYKPNAEFWAFSRTALPIAGNLVKRLADGIDDILTRSVQRQYDGEDPLLAVCDIRNMAIKILEEATSILVEAWKEPDEKKEKRKENLSR